MMDSRVHKPFFGVIKFAAGKMLIPWNPFSSSGLQEIQSQI